MMKKYHWAHQEPPASDDFFTPGVKWDRRPRPATAVHGENDDDLVAIFGAAPPTSPIKIHKTQQDPSQSIAKWHNREQELVQAKLKEWIQKKQRELLSANRGGQASSSLVLPTSSSPSRTPRQRKRQSVPTTPIKPSTTIPLVSPTSSARHRALPLTAPATPSKAPLTSSKSPKAPRGSAESQAAYLEWLQRKSAELDRATTERARQEKEQSATRAAASALAEQRYHEWKTTRKMPSPPIRPKLHQFPIAPVPTPTDVADPQAPRITFADVFGDIAFHPGNLPDAAAPQHLPSISKQHPGTNRHVSHPRLAFGRPISTSGLALAKSPPSTQQRATLTGSGGDSAMDPPNLLSPPSMFEELERMQRHYPAYLKRFPGHVAHAGASVGKIWVDPSHSIREQAAAEAKWARLNAAVGCYCHEQDKTSEEGPGRQ